MMLCRTRTCRAIWRVSCSSRGESIPGGGYLLLGIVVRRAAAPVEGTSSDSPVSPGTETDTEIDRYRNYPW